MDEYGGLCGLITIEDLLEEIVGDIEDEYDLEQDPVISLQENGIYVADAKSPLEDVEEKEPASACLRMIGKKKKAASIPSAVMSFSWRKRIPGHGEIINGPLTGSDLKFWNRIPTASRKS